MLQLVFRVLHIAATCTSLGGLVYARMVLWPALDLLPEPQRGSFLGSAIRRFAYIKWTGVSVVAVTGIVQWIWTYPYVMDHQLYLLYFVIKMAGAVGLSVLPSYWRCPLRSCGVCRHTGHFGRV